MLKESGKNSFMQGCLGKNSSNPEPEIEKALTPSVSALSYDVVDVTTLINALSALSAIAAEADRSGSNSTSTKLTEAVEKVPAASAEPEAPVPIVSVPDDLSLIEYPNLPAPYKPPVASVLDPDVLPYTSEFSVWLPVCAVPYLKSR